METLIRDSIGKCQAWWPWPESGNLALEPRDPKSGDFNKGLNRKVPGLVALAKKLPGLPIRFWHSLVATI